MAALTDNFSAGLKKKKIVSVAASTCAADSAVVIAWYSKWHYCTVQLPHIFFTQCYSAVVRSYYSVAHYYYAVALPHS